MTTFNSYKDYMQAVTAGERGIKFLSLTDGKPIDSTPFITKPYSEKLDIDSIRDGSCC